MLGADGLSLWEEQGVALMVHTDALQGHRGEVMGAVTQLSHLQNNKDCVLYVPREQASGGAGQDYRY